MSKFFFGLMPKNSSAWHNPYGCVVQTLDYCMNPLMSRPNILGHKALVTLKAEQLPVDKYCQGINVPAKLWQPSNMNCGCIE